MSLEKEALRGRQAQEVIENPIYSESFDTIRAEIIAQWEASRDAADREQLHQLLGLLGKTKNALESVMRTGEVAAAEIARKQSDAEKMALYSIRKRA